jgi:hypothetical protein
MFEILIMKKVLEISGRRFVLNTSKRAWIFHIAPEIPLPSKKSTCGMPGYGGHWRGSNKMKTTNFYSQEHTI